MSEKSKMGYSNAKIYSIRNSVDDDIYIGHTTQALSKRFQKHKSNCKNKDLQDRKLYQKMNTLGIDKFYIEKEHDCKDCKDVEDVRKIEGEWIRKLGTLNFQIAGRPIPECRAEYIKKDPERWKEYAKNWQEKNKESEKERLANSYKERKEQIRERKNEKIQCECGAVHSRRYKAIHIKSKKHQNYLNNNIEIHDEIQEEKCQDGCASSSS